MLSSAWRYQKSTVFFLGAISSYAHHSSFPVTHARYVFQNLVTFAGDREDLTNEEQKAAKEQIFNSKEVSMWNPWKVPSIFLGGLWKSGGDRSVRGNEEIIYVRSEAP